MQFATWTALLAGCAAMLWGRLQALFAFAGSLLFDTRVLDEHLGGVLENYLTDHARLRLAPRPTVTHTVAWLDRAESYGSELYEVVGERAVFLMPGGRLIWFSGGRTARQVSALRGWVRLDRVLVAANDYRQGIMAERQRGRTDRFRIEVLQGRAGEPLAVAQPGRDIFSPSRGIASAAVSSDRLPAEILPLGVRLLTTTHERFSWSSPAVGGAEAVIPTPEIEACMASFRAWYDDRLWYAERYLPWRLGWQFQGSPGSGKTFLAAAIARDLGLPLFVLDLASMGNQDLKRCWDQVRDNAPCLCAIEDIDAVYHGRELAEEGRGPTFNALLNTLGGAQPADGVALIITTNRPELVDAALCRRLDDGRASRPGRVDKVLVLGPATEAQRRAMVERYLRGVPADAEALVAEGDGDTAVQFANRCRDIALEWRAGGRPADLAAAHRVA